MLAIDTSQPRYLSGYLDNGEPGEAVALAVSQVPGFLPSINGFLFGNSFPHLPARSVGIPGVVSIPLGDASNGMAGGMVFAVRDFFEAGLTPSRVTTPPGEGPFFDYLVARLFASFDLPDGPARYLELMSPLRSDSETTFSRLRLAPKGRIATTLQEEWPKVKTDIDSGHPCPIGLIQVRSSDPFDLKENSQVLAYSYELAESHLTLHVYDPNQPGRDDVTLSAGLQPSEETTALRYYPDGVDVFAFFRISYRPAEVPVELIDAWAVAPVPTPHDDGSAKRRTPARSRVTDAVRTLVDRPTGKDHLARSFFAKILATRIEQVRRQEMGVAQSRAARKTSESVTVPASATTPQDSLGSFMIHIDGPWGAGKSSLLLLLRERLKMDEPPGAQWAVIDFNAWRHERIDPPWWSLMDAVYRQSLPQLPKGRRRSVKRKELWWRLRKGGAAYVIALLLLVAVSLLLWMMYRGRGTPIGEVLGTVGTILSVGGALWATVLAISKAMVLGSARAARSFAESARDPMGEVKAHFERLVGWIAPSPIAIFIDDIDRCQPAYVVRLLEGIQTLFSDAPVTYVVAADRRWLYTSFETVYGSYLGNVHEAGRRLGMLFLEKTFQVSTTIPGMPIRTRDEYWDFLLQAEPSDRDRRVEDEKDRAERELARSETEEEMVQSLNRVVRTEGDSPRAEAFRRAAVDRVAGEAFQGDMQHRLAKFGPLLDSNPRSMVRLVNAYALQLPIELYLLSPSIAPAHLAQLIILDQRWPLLLDYLQEHPNALKDVGQRAPEDAPQDIRPLFRDEDVVAVITGKWGRSRICRPLTEKAVVAYTGIRIPYPVKDVAPGSRPGIAATPVEYLGSL